MGVPHGFWGHVNNPELSVEFGKVYDTTYVSNHTVDITKEMKGSAFSAEWSAQFYYQIQPGF